MSSNFLLLVEQSIASPYLVALLFADYQFMYTPSNCYLPPDNLVPYDGVPNEETVSVEAGLAAVFIVLATAGIIFALVCIIFNAVNRNKK